MRTTLIELTTAGFRVPRLEPVQHHINDNPRHRNVKPDRQRPARDATVRIEPFAQCATQGNQREWHYRYRQDRMREEDREIDRTNPTPAFEGYRTDLVVVKQIRDQKQDRAAEGDQHAIAMCAAITRLDETKAGEKKYGAEAIQRRI